MASKRAPRRSQMGTGTCFAHTSISEGRKRWMLTMIALRWLLVPLIWWSYSPDSSNITSHHPDLTTSSTNHALLHSFGSCNTWTRDSPFLVLEKKCISREQKRSKIASHSKLALFLQYCWWQPWVWDMTAPNLYTTGTFDRTVSKGPYYLPLSVFPSRLQILVQKFLTAATGASPASSTGSALIDPIAFGVPSTVHLIWPALVSGS